MFCMRSREAKQMPSSVKRPLIEKERSCFLVDRKWHGSIGEKSSQSWKVSQELDDSWEWTQTGKLGFLCTDFRNFLFLLPAQVTYKCKQTGCAQLMWSVKLKLPIGRVSNYNGKQDHVPLAEIQSEAVWILVSIINCMSAYLCYDITKP